MRARELRSRMTCAEKKLWHEYLRNLPFPVLRQKPLDNYIVDFYCPRLKLVVEVDGKYHAGEHAMKYDAMRTAILEGYGLRVIRFSNRQVLNEFRGVCDVMDGIVAGTG
jgi:very-short-patch-repair endonuclease